MRGKTFLFGYPLDLASQSAMKLPFVFDFKLRTNAPCLALVISLLISLLVCFYYLNFVRAHAPK